MNKQSHAARGKRLVIITRGRMLELNPALPLRSSPQRHGRVRNPFALQLIGDGGRAVLFEQLREHITERR
jgi:hypothetical protein